MFKSLNHKDHKGHKEPILHLYWFLIFVWTAPASPILAQPAPVPVLESVKLLPIREATGRKSIHILPTGVAYRGGKLIMSANINDPLLGHDASSFALLVSDEKWPDLITQRIELHLDADHVGGLAYSRDIDRFFLMNGKVNSWNIFTFKLRVASDNTLIVDPNTTGILDIQNVHPRNLPEHWVPFCVNSAGTRITIGWSEPKCADSFSEYAIGPTWYKHIFYKNPSTPSLFRKFVLEVTDGHSRKIRGLMWAPNGLFVLSSSPLKGNMIQLINVESREVRSYLDDFSLHFGANGMTESSSFIYVIFNPNDPASSDHTGRIAAIPKLALN